MSVEKGNTVHVPSTYLGGSEAKKINVKWSQNLSTKSADYYIGKYTNKSGGSSEENMIFIQVSKLDEFKNKKTSGDDFTFNVDDSFQYGQKKDGSKRFLVYHDKNNKMYQHRFVANTITSLGDKANEFATSMGYPQLGSAEDLAKNFIGDYLKNF